MKTDKGRVALVGAGCAAGLITCRGLDAVRCADVIVYDDLLDAELLSEKKPGCRLIYAGKRSGRKSMRQEEIHDILVSQARAGNFVVRLKGGDGFIFGRGGEEAQALMAAGVDFFAVPGVSSGISGPELFGLPLTHRGMSQSVTFVTGHGADGIRESFDALAGLSGTLVFFMGLSAAGEISKKLMAAGKDPQTPVAVISRAHMAGGRRLDGTLAELEEFAKKAEPPALLVVGETAAMHLAAENFLPAKGTRVCICGSKGFVKKAEREFRAFGAHVSGCVCVRIEPCTENIPEDLTEYTWLAFTSPNGVRIFFDHMREKKLDLRSLCHVKFAALGMGTAEELEKHGFFADLIPNVHDSEHFGKELGKILKKDDRLLILRSALGSLALCRELEKAGSRFLDCHIYTAAADPGALDCEDADYMVFGSRFGAQSYKKHHALPHGAKIVCMGEETARAFAGRDVILPLEHTAESLAAAVAEDLGLYKEEKNL